MLERDIFGLQKDDYSRVEREMTLEKDGRDYGVWLLGELEDNFHQDEFAEFTRLYAGEQANDSYFYFGLGIGIDLTPELFKKNHITQKISKDIKEKMDRSIEVDGDSMSFEKTWYVDLVGKDEFDWIHVRLYNMVFHGGMDEVVGILKGFGYATATFAQGYIENTGGK